MIEGVVPREIREGPAAIRATVDMQTDARQIATRWRAAAARLEW